MPTVKLRTAIGALSVLTVIAVVVILVSSSERRSQPADRELRDDPRERPAANLAGDLPLEIRTSTEPSARGVSLLLVRHPDEALLARTVFETDPPLLVPSGGRPETAEDGRVVLEVTPRMTALEIRAQGFEPARVTLAPDAREVRVALVPSSGLFGRVIFADGRPAPGATVELIFEEGYLAPASGATSSQPRASIRLAARTLSTGVANTDGWYYVPHETRTTATAVDLRASVADGYAAVRRVELPRQPVAVEDIVLRDPDRLHIRVVDRGGTPVAQVKLKGRRGVFPGETDARGELALTSPELPVLLEPRADGYGLRERRHDGQIMPLETMVESCSTMVELVLEPLPGAHLRMIDAATSAPIDIGNVRIQLVRSGANAGAGSFQAAGRGSARVYFVPPGVARTGGAYDLPDLARIYCSSEGYRDGFLEVDLHTLEADERLVIALEADPEFGCLHGRVVREGVPIGGFPLGLKAQARADGLAAQGWQYTRTSSDDEGRFTLRWRQEPGVVVTVFPHWVEFAEFGFIGPLDGARATEGEYDLELVPAVRVPAVLRGVEAGAPYSYYIKLLDESGAVGVQTTINGAPIELDGWGEVQTSLMLPRTRRVLVTIGYQSAAAVFPDGSPPVMHDPGNVALPLVFELPKLFARVTGWVKGVPGNELSRLRVTFERENEEQARLAPLASDGSFTLDSLPLGKGALYLVRQSVPEAQPAAPELLARVKLDLMGDRDGIVLAPDPASLSD